MDACIKILHWGWQILPSYYLSSKKTIIKKALSKSNEYKLDWWMEEWSKRSEKLFKLMLGDEFGEIKMS